MAKTAILVDDRPTESSVALLERLRDELDAEKEENPTPPPARRPTSLYAIITVLVVICSVLSILLYQQHLQIQTLEQSLSDVTNLANIRANRIKNLESNISGLYERINEIRDELNFWQDYAVIVTETGDKYHSYGCSHIANRSFYIYNIESAKAKGYTACSDCSGRSAVNMLQDLLNQRGP